MKNKINCILIDKIWIDEAEEISQEVWDSIKIWEGNVDLREKLLIDLFDTMHEMDKGNPTYKDLSDEQKIKARPVAEGMIERGWYFNQEKGKL